MRIYLMGYMGSGKSTTGELLAKVLQLPFFDLDKEIEKAAGCTISQIFSTQGEDNFRNLETETLLKLSSMPDFVMALGGGAPCYNKNIELINKTGDGIYLKLDIIDLANRLKNDANTRPLLKNKPHDKLIKHITRQVNDRKKYYSKAKYTIDCKGKPVEKIIEEIKSIYSK